MKASYRNCTTAGDLKIPTNTDKYRQCEQSAVVSFYVVFSVFEKQRSKQRISIDFPFRSLLGSHF